MAMAFGCLVMLGAGMIAAFLVGARVARSSISGIAAHGLPSAARPEIRLSDASAASEAAQSVAAFEGRPSAPPGEECSPADTDAPVRAKQAPLDSRPPAWEETAPSPSPGAGGNAPEQSASFSTADAPAPEADFATSRRAADAALEAAAHRYDLDGAEEAAALNLFINARKHPRGNFRGTALATIYPHESRRNKEPIQCVVLTRDLSCSGIGIAHSEQLYPKQIVVLEAVGKLLVGEVRWCRRVDDNFYVAGCRLVKTAA
jgi:hypothetical protein